MKTRDVSKRKPSGVSTVDTPSRPRSAKTRKTTRKAAGDSTASGGKPAGDNLCKIHRLSLSVKTRKIADSFKVSRRTAQRWVKAGRNPEADGMCCRRGKNGRIYTFRARQRIERTEIETDCRKIGYAMNAFERHVSERGFTDGELRAFEGIVNRANGLLDWLKAARERGDAK